MKKIQYKDIKISKKLKSQTDLTTNQLKSLVFQNLKEIQRKREIAKKEKLQSKFDFPFFKNKNGEYVLKKAYTPDPKYISLRLQEKYQKLQQKKNKSISNFNVKIDFKKGSKLFFSLLNQVYKIDKLTQQDLIKIYENIIQTSPYFINYIFGNHDNKKYKDYNAAVSSGKETIIANKQIVEKAIKEVISAEKLALIIK